MPEGFRRVPKGFSALTQFCKTGSGMDRLSHRDLAIPTYNRRTCCHDELQTEEGAMPDVLVATPRGHMPCYLAVPQSQAPFPGVIVLHDVGGMSHDHRNQADWLARAGFHPDAGHSFMNNKQQWWFKLLRFSGIAYNEPAAMDARIRIAEFFRTHLVAGFESPPVAGNAL
jgi:hypothetical protein